MTSAAPEPSAQRCRVLLDDIIFKLQRFGGASDFWRAMTGHLESMPELELLRVEGSRRTRFLPVGTDADVIHSSHFRVPARPGPACVTTIHDLTFELGLVGGLASGPNRWQRRQAVRRADGIVCISEHTREELMTYYGEAITTDVPVEVIHHGRTYRTRSGEPLPPSLSGHAPYILHVGNRAGYKNFRTLLEAYAASALVREGVSLLCTGAAFDAQESEHIGRLTRGADQVVNVGHVTTSTLGLLYEHALGLAYPSAYEGFGLPPLDAMSLGCPVVAANNTSVPEVVGDAGRLVDPTDVDGLAEALDAFLDHRERARLSSAGLARAQLFDWNRAAESYASFYRELANRA